MLYTFTSYESVYDLYVAILKTAIVAAVTLSLLVSMDRLYKVGKYMQVAARAHLTGRKPEHSFQCNSLPDPQQYSLVYPRVAVQLPMFNERAVCQAIIDSACELSWPKNRFKVQVLDDSTDRTTRDLVDDKVVEWRERGVNIEVMRRTNRAGYKAGALKEGLERLAEYDYVAIFDADFKPDADFLLLTVPYLIDNPEVGYVQTRWIFANPDESYLTKAQEISLNFHCKCEQYVQFATGGFFNFNGTAGIWRRKTIVTVGGWKSRTTVEDMDLSLRTFVNGWKAIYLTETTCINELPASFFAYRKQQHRWTCGPVQLWRKAAVDIWGSSLPLFSKLDLIFCYFGIRKFATHWVSLGFFCTIVPLSVFTPEVGTALYTICNMGCSLFCAAAHCAKLTVNLPGAELGNTHALYAFSTQLQQLFLNLCGDVLSLLLRSMSAIACFAHGILVVSLMHSNHAAGLNSTVGPCAPAGGGHSHHCHLHTKGMAPLHPVCPV
ncbi:TPA: hypothetical protein ACH3X1_010513 [Trebouxia sp. C0004]